MLTDHARELHRRTQGHIASLTNLIDRVCYLAITTGEETITADLLATATTDNAAHTQATQHQGQPSARPRPQLGVVTPGPAADPAKNSAREPPRRGSRIREMPAGYDLGPLPILVAVGEGESVVSWLRRVSWRYDIPARHLLRDAGTPQTLSGTSKVAPRLRNNHQLLDRLGLPLEETARLLASTRSEQPPPTI